MIFPAHITHLIGDLFFNVVFFCCFSPLLLYVFLGAFHTPLIATHFYHAVLPFLLLIAGTANSAFVTDDRDLEAQASQQSPFR